MGLDVVSSLLSRQDHWAAVLTPRCVTGRGVGEVLHHNQAVGTAVDDRDPYHLELRREDILTMAVAIHQRRMRGLHVPCICEVLSNNARPDLMIYEALDHCPAVARPMG